MKQAAHELGEKLPNSLPPRALKGRWMSIHNVEIFLTSCGALTLPAVFKRALVDKLHSKKASKKGLNGGHQGNDDDHDDAMDGSQGRAGH